jgi:hypothetical protein
MSSRQIDIETLHNFRSAADRMGAVSGKQNFRTAGPAKFNTVDAFSTFFGEWAIQKESIVVHLFPRAGASDVWYDAKYLDRGRRYIPGRREFKPAGLSFPTNIEDVIKEAANAVTFGDVELSSVEELGAWAIRFCDISSFDDWLKDDGLLEQFFAHIDRSLESD